MMGLQRMCGIVRSGLQDYKIKVTEYLQIIREIEIREIEIHEIDMAAQVSCLKMILVLP